MFNVVGDTRMTFQVLHSQAEHGKRKIGGQPTTYSINTCDAASTDLPYITRYVLVIVRLFDEYSSVPIYFPVYPYILATILPQTHIIKWV